MTATTASVEFELSGQPSSTSQSKPRPALPEAVRLLGPCEPAWVREWLGPVTAAGWGYPFSGKHDISVSAEMNEKGALVCVTVRGARRFWSNTFRIAVREAYNQILHWAIQDAGLNMVRFWNFIPDIHGFRAFSLDRYKIFNAGRHDAYSSFVGNEAFPQTLPTATAVGTEGQDLVIYGFATTEPGTPIENPRQTPAYRYSKQYGPLPPCFSRAMLLSSSGSRQHTLLIGGTASVRGEHSMHKGDVAEQTRETMANMAAVIRRASSLIRHKDLREDQQPWLESIKRIRVHYPREEDLPTIMEEVSLCVGKLDRLEWMKADLCRRELRVEISGIATIEGPG